MIHSTITSCQNKEHTKYPSEFSELIYIRVSAINFGWLLHYRIIWWSRVGKL